MLQDMLGTLVLAHDRPSASYVRALTAVVGWGWATCAALATLGFDGSHARGDERSPPHRADLPEDWKLEPAWIRPGGCGPQAAYMLARIAGYDLQVEDVFRLVPPDPVEGTSLAALERGLRALGVPASSRFFAASELRTAPMPLVVHLTQSESESRRNHFSVLVGFVPENQRYGMIDGSSGNYNLVLAEGIERSFSGYALSIEGKTNVAVVRASAVLQGVFLSLAGLVACAAALYLALVWQQRGRRGAIAGDDAGADARSIA